MIHESVPEDERPFQSRRRLFAIVFASGLFLFSIALEVFQREIDPLEMRDNVAKAVRAVNPDTPFPSVEAIPNLLGIVAVLRNMIPALIMLWLVFYLGTRFVKAVYNTLDQEAEEYLMTSLFGPLSGSGPPLVRLLITLALGPLAKGKLFLVVSGGNILGSKDKPKDRPEVKIGGPVNLIVHNDSAVLLERVGKLTRALGPGLYPLRRFEKVRNIIDLRPQPYRLTVSGMSQEGIPIKWPIEVHFQINDEDGGPHAATNDQPYAYSDKALFKATTEYWLREFEYTDHQNWRDRLMGGEAEGTLRNYMASYPLDQLIQDAYALRQKVHKDLEAKLKANAAKHGAKILKVTLGDIELKDSAAQQWLETWQAKWKSQLQIDLSKDEGERLRQIERVKAAAKREMLSAILEAFQELAERSDKVDPKKIVEYFTEIMRQHAAPFIHISGIDDAKLDNGPARETKDETL